MNCPDSLTVEKCGVLLQMILVAIRELSREKGQDRKIFELADLAHNIPRFMVGHDDHVGAWLREGLMEYAEMFHPELPPEMSRFVMIFDMNESDFHACYSPLERNWAEFDSENVAGPASELAHR